MDKREKTARTDNSFIGAAGVHYAAYKLTRKGMIALPTVRNTPGTDLMVTSADGRRHANIQVKATNHKAAQFWIICSTKKFEEPKFSLCIYVDKGPRHEDWNLPTNSKEKWRWRWQQFDLRVIAKG